MVPSGFLGRQGFEVRAVSVPLAQFRSRRAQVPARDSTVLQPKEMDGMQ